MLLSFRKSKKQKVAVNNDVSDKIAKSIFDSCIRCQRKWAGWMQSKTQQLSVRIKLVMLLSFSVITAGYSIYLISFSFSGRQLLSFSIESIKKPAYLTKPGNNSEVTTIINKKELLRIQNFKGFMDSLTRSPSGKKIFDSIVTIHPGLMDSIVLIENIYQPQIKK